MLLSAHRNIGCVDNFYDCVTGFIDSLTVFQEVYPDQDSYKQEHLVQSILKSSYAAHDTIEDVTSLGKLMTHTDLATADIIKHIYPPLQSITHSCLVKQNQTTMILSAPLFTMA